MNKYFICKNDTYAMSNKIMYKIVKFNINLDDPLQNACFSDDLGHS
jgi:hypothetical protein